MARPREIMSNITEFAELSNADNLINYVESTVDPSRQNKWSKLLNEATLEEIRTYMASTLNQLGYEW